MSMRHKIGAVVAAGLCLVAASCSRTQDSSSSSSSSSSSTSSAAAAPGGSTSAAAASGGGTSAAAASGGSSSAAAASGGNSASVGNSNITIGLAVANLQADFFNQIKLSAEAQAKASGVKLIVSDAGGDSDKQVSQIQDFITAKVSAIIYIPAGASAADVPVTDAKKAGIPVVTVDRNPSSAPGDTFIATDSVAAAKTLGEWVIKQKNGTANYAILQGQLGTTPQLDREKGWNEAMATAPGFKKVAEDTANWAQDAALSLAQNMLTANSNIDVIWGQADAMAQGAAQAVKLANVGHPVLVVGFDGDTTALPDIKSGKFAATMVQQVVKMGQMSVTSAIDLVNGKKLPATQLQPAFLATKDNVDQYISQHP